MSNNPYAKVICDSVSPSGKRIISIECRYWRGIHSELMTHRAFARNAASSRAIPFYREAKGDDQAIHYYTDSGLLRVIPKCTLGMLINDPFIPEFIGAEQKGMQSGEELSPENKSKAVKIIQDLLDESLTATKKLYDLGVHKSIINRYLEPWSYITTLITATEWNNFFALRIHPAAEKHFNQLAVLIKKAMDESTPTPLQKNDYHLPYIQTLDCDTIHDMIENRTEFVDYQCADEAMDMLKQVSAARSARTSYLTQDGKRDISEDLKLFERLRNPGDGAFHASPFEHVAQPASTAEVASGPFRGWIQFRKEFPNENVPG